jgi:hypothetical protein
MAGNKDKYTPKPTPEIDTTPFDSAEEAWFWFIETQKAKEDGARFLAGMGLYRRPCEPVYILKILDRLHRNRCLKMDHFLVLRHYGRRQLRPDHRRVKEVRAYYLWNEAMKNLEPPMISKGIVTESVDSFYIDRKFVSHHHIQGEIIFENRRDI